jgi:hypothetical protein
MKDRAVYSISVGFVAVVLMAIGATGTWATVLGQSIHGTDGGRDGWVVVAAAIIAAVFLFLMWLRHRTGFAVVVLLAGAAAAATAAYDVSDTNSLSDRYGGLVSTGWGLYLALIGSIATMVAAIAAYFEVGRREREERIEEDAEILHVPPSDVVE